MTFASYGLIHSKTIKQVLCARHLLSCILVSQEQIRPCPFGGRRWIVCIRFILIIGELVNCAYTDIHIASLMVCRAILIYPQHTKKDRLVYFLIILWSVISTSYHGAGLTDLGKTLDCVHLPPNKRAAINLGKKDWVKNRSILKILFWSLTDLNITIWFPFLCQSELLMVTYLHSIITKFNVWEYKLFHSEMLVFLFRYADLIQPGRYFSSKMSLFHNNKELQFGSCCLMHKFLETKKENFYREEEIGRAILNSSSSWAPWSM